MQRLNVLDKGEIIFNNSASGSVYLAKQNNNGAMVAVKEMVLSRQPRKDMIINEIKIMKETTHPNIVNFKDCFLVKDSLWVIMEYMEGGMLTDIIDKEKFTEPQIAAICLEVYSLLIYLDTSRSASFAPAQHYPS
jgi:serine/threonine protein kinase